MEYISEARAEKIFPNLGSHRILVLGDVMLDEYLWGNVSRISPEAPVPVVEILKENIKLGGAANVALNLKTLGDVPLLVGVVGEDRDGERLKEKLDECGLSGQGIFIDQNRKTTIKTRIIAQSQQVVRADRENSEEISEHFTEKILNFIKSQIKNLSGVIISDYGKGVSTLNLLTELIALVRKNNVFIGVDPKETHFMNYRKVTFITPNHHEAGFAYGKRIKDESSLEEVGWGLLEKLDADSLLITRGEKGMSLFEKNHTLAHFPTRAKEVYDVTGAGDTVISTFASAFAAGADFKEASFLSNHAAGIVVGEVGTAQVTKEELMEDVKGFIRD
jgi:rfaE bifunctional protein kinase chain/domain